MDSSHPGWENILLSWRIVTRSPVCGADLVNYAANQWPRSRLSWWPFVAWPWWGCFWLGFENDRGSCFALGAEVVADFSISMIWILYVEPIGWLKTDRRFCRETVGHSLHPVLVESLAKQAPWWEWMRHWVFSSDFTACRETEVPWDLKFLQGLWSQSEQGNKCHFDTAYLGLVTYIAFIFKPLMCIGQLTWIMFVGPCSIFFFTLSIVFVDFNSK